MGPALPTAGEELPSGLRRVGFGVGIALNPRHPPRLWEWELWGLSGHDACPAVFAGCTLLTWVVLVESFSALVIPCVHAPACPSFA